MKSKLFWATAASAFVVTIAPFSIKPVSAHALLESATPAVGGTVNGSPGTIELRFSEGVEARYSRISVSGPGGAVPVSPASGASGSPVLSARLGQRLKAGRYRVQWSVVSVDTHQTQGSFSFEVRP